MFTGATYEGEEIAVKKFRQDVGRLDDKEFDNEVLNLREIQHQNIVRLLGYCYVSHHMYVNHNGGIVRAEHIERLLCFEYMQGGSLEKHISDESCDLDWRTCFKIIRGICEGLNHLHTTKGKPIYHLDLKPANILLDKNHTAKLGDLGLSNLATSTKTRRTDVVKGTQGYMPPEYINDGVVSNKFDVFSLGVIIIKMLAGNTGYYHRLEMPPQRFIEFVTEKWKEKLQGTKVYLSQEADILQLKTCVDMALRCVKDERNERPDIKGIVNELEKLEPQINKISTNPTYYRSGVCQDIRQKEQQIMLAPSEIIKQVLGTTGTVGEDTVVTSLILVSNLTKYGPFGTTNGTPFCSEDPESNKSVAGFYARAGEAVNALGVYHTPEN